MAARNDGPQATHVADRTPESKDRERVTEDVAACDRALHDAYIMHFGCRELARAGDPVRKDIFVMPYPCPSSPLSKGVVMRLSSLQITPKRRLAFRNEMPNANLKRDVERRTIPARTHFAEMTGKLSVPIGWPPAC